MSSPLKTHSILRQMRRIADSEHINLLLTRDMLRDIDAWRRLHEQLPNRTAAIRELLRFALDLKLRKRKAKGEK
jgi:hypothetical protein